MRALEPLGYAFAAPRGVERGGDFPGNDEQQDAAVQLVVVIAIADNDGLRQTGVVAALGSTTSGRVSSLPVVVMADLKQDGALSGRGP